MSPLPKHKAAHWALQKPTRSSFKNSKLSSISASLLFLFFYATGTAFCQSHEEYTVKAAFIVNFAKFSHWPEDTFASSADTLNLCLIKGKPLAPFFKSIEGKKIGGQTLALRYINKKEELDGCHILFVNKKVNGDYLSEMFDTVKGKPVLTIGEKKNFARDGGVINFITKGKKLRFEINMKRASQQKIRLSSQLLKLAILVGE